MVLFLYSSDSISGVCLGRNPHIPSLLLYGRYLSQLFVKDVHTNKTWTFIYNDWLAVDRGSLLQTTASVSSVSKEELAKKRQHNFTVKSTRDLREGHLWISIFSKPARSTFTRVQRLTCGLCLLLMTMLTNIMFYGIPTNDPADQVGGTGGISFSLSAVVIGIEASLLMFPVNLLILQLFLKLKPRPVEEEMTREVYLDAEEESKSGRVENQSVQDRVRNQSMQDRVRNQSVRDRVRIPLAARLSELFMFGQKKTGREHQQLDQAVLTDTGKHDLHVYRFYIAHTMTEYIYQEN